MKALRYLIFHRVKNQLISFFQKPSRAILFLAIVVLLGAALILPNREFVEAADLLPMRNLYAMGYGLFILLFCLTAYQGLGRGVSLFTMSDVSLMFPSPLSAQQILFYGCAQTLGRYMLMSLFLIGQYGWLHTGYGVTVPQLLLIWLLYAMSCFLGQLTAMVLYACINGNPRRRRIATVGFFGVIGCFAVSLFVMALQSHRPGLMAITTLVNRPLIKWFPVGGWMGAIFQAALSGRLSDVLIFAGISLAYAGVMGQLIRRVGTDFYEDVLDATARSYQAITAQKEGRMTESLPDHVRRGKEGFTRGVGASVLYEKHRIEARRAGRLPFSTQTIVFIISHLVFSYVMRESGFMPSLAFGVYILFFSANSGRWVRELTLPWVYRIPEPAFKKLLWCLRESVQELFFQSVILMVGSGVIVGEKPLTIAIAVLCHFLLALLFMAGNIAGDRLYGQVQSRMIALLLYSLMMLLLLAPSILLLVLALSKGWVFYSINVTLMTLIALPTLLLTPLSLWFGRHLLDNVEMNG